MNVDVIKKSLSYVKGIDVLNILFLYIKMEKIINTNNKRQDYYHIKHLNRMRDEIESVVWELYLINILEYFRINKEDWMFRSIKIMEHWCWERSTYIDDEITLVNEKQRRNTICTIYEFLFYE